VVPCKMQTPSMFRDKKSGCGSNVLLVIFIIVVVVIVVSIGLL
jgi:hypothetical protein